MIIHKNPNPKTKPVKGEPLGFGKIFTDHMVIMEHTQGKGWGEPRIEPYAPFSIEPSALVFHYGQAIFEGLKAFRGYDGKIRLFRPDRYLARMNRSAKRLCIPEIDIETVHKAAQELVKLDQDWIPQPEDGALYLRPFIIASDPMLGVHASKGYIFCIIACPVGAYFAHGFNPVKILTCTDYIRACPGGLGEAKTAANYAASLLGGEEANKVGYDQVLWLDAIEKKYIEEVGAMNIFFKFGDEVATPMLTGSILPGVTRLSTLDLLKSWGMKATERRISIDEVAAGAKSGELKEIFGTGTAAVIAPVSGISWEGQMLEPAHGGVGPLTKKLYETITSIQYGQAPDALNWTEVVVG